MLKNTWKKAIEDKGAIDTADLARFFMACRSGKSPSLWSMVLDVFADMEKTIGKTDVTPLKTACLAAEHHNGNAYHNEHHSREVTLLTSLLLLKHIKEGNNAGFTARDARNLLMAAAVHDLDHDGGSNTVNGVHHPLRLENHSFNLAVNLWRNQDVTRDDLRFIHACIVPTDISKSSEGVSPRDSLIETFNVSSNKSGVYGNKLWREAAAMLSDADLAISGALSPEMFAVNSMILEEETKGAVPANNASAKYFLNNVLSSFPLSNEGRSLLKNGYNKVRASVFGE